MKSRERKHRVKPLGRVAKAATTASAAVAIRVALSLAAMSAHKIITPESHSWKPVLALSFFLLLVIRRNGSGSRIQFSPALSPTAIGIFVVLHILLAIAGLRISSEMTVLDQSSRTSAALLAVNKIVVVVPTAVLFTGPVPQLRELVPEAMAAGIALFTFDPGKLLAFVWPSYLRIIAGLIHLLSWPFLSGSYVVISNREVLVVGPNRDMLLDASCSGIKGIVLFQVLFAMMLLREWNRLNRGRSLFVYAAACIVLMLSNTVRLTVVFLSSNLTSGAINPSWPLLVLTLLALTWFTYDWIMPRGEHLYCE